MLPPRNPNDDLQGEEESTLPPLLPGISLQDVQLSKLRYFSSLLCKIDNQQGMIQNGTVHYRNEVDEHLIYACHEASIGSMSDDVPTGLPLTNIYDAWPLLFPKIKRTRDSNSTPSV